MTRTHTHIYIYIHTHTHTHTHICIYIYISTHTHIHIDTSTCARASVPRLCSLLLLPDPTRSSRLSSTTTRCGSSRATMTTIATTCSSSMCVHVCACVCAYSPGSVRCCCLCELAPIPAFLRCSLIIPLGSLHSLTAHQPHCCGDDHKSSALTPDSPSHDREQKASGPPEPTRGLKPMNCPAHCLIFASSSVSASTCVCVCVCVCVRACVCV